MQIKKIALGSDHAGFDYKDPVKKLLLTQGIEVIDYGTDSPDSVDYPDFIHPVADAVESEKVDLGIIFCGSGNGAAMTANKHQQIRCALCWTAELAELARQHNDANVLSIPVRFIEEEVALDMVRVFISTEFEDGRHARRVRKIACGF